MLEMLRECLNESYLVMKIAKCDKNRGNLKARSSAVLSPESHKRASRRVAFDNRNKIREYR